MEVFPVLESIPFTHILEGDLDSEDMCSDSSLVFYEASESVHIPEIL